jgi:hypothetical protein
MVILFDDRYVPLLR